MDYLPIFLDIRGRHVLIVGGGDGTVNAALKGIVEAGLPLGVLPLGTVD